MFYGADHIPALVADELHAIVSMSAAMHSRHSTPATSWGLCGAPLRPFVTVTSLCLPGAFGDENSAGLRKYPIAPSASISSRSRRESEDVTTRTRALAQRKLARSRRSMSPPLHRSAAGRHPHGRSTGAARLPPLLQRTSQYYLELT
jgi:hypothetical protein